MTESVPVAIYHNPACGTSRNVLVLIRNAGVEPTLIEYLKTPPHRAILKDLLQRMGMRPPELLRERGTPYAELDLGADHWTDEQLICQILAHPILISRFENRVTGSALRANGAVPDIVYSWFSTADEKVKAQLVR